MKIVGGIKFGKRENPVKPPNLRLSLTELPARPVSILMNVLYLETNQ